ncbi:DUF1285 domain-containing protein [uncultured Brevundimonas sp.]|uniref:DUF1285 domain-containing protein n=1 Tax=uncultured Brevundimonas sp. TaxID=213418 RepID=UPI00262A62F3|nr:DUF1285 domain-containing protein [uncultured Brevundimonas sp.]
MENGPNSQTKSSNPLEEVAKAAKQAPGRGLPPVHLWHPAHCGDIDILIRADGVWMHEGSPIGRPELVRLFSTILRKDPDGYHLVTPVEKLKIKVEDLPFRATQLEGRDGKLVFTTDRGDEVLVSETNPLVVDTDPVTGEPSPRVLVRGDLWARVVRAVFYDLVERAEEIDGALAVRSGDDVFALGPKGAGL